MTPCELVPATAADQGPMQTMATYYVYDISQFCGDEPGWAFPETGLYGGPDMADYFADAQAHPFLIRRAGELAGFAIVDTKGSTPDIEFNMAQFWVHRKFIGRGVGASAAFQLFARYPGLWEVNVIPANLAAFAFWRRVIHRYAVGPVAEGRRPAPHLRNQIKDLFRFRTG